MDAGLRGSRPPRGRALALRLGAIAAFLALWSLLSGAVVVFKLFNPIFLPGPWLVLGNVLELAVRGPALDPRGGDARARRARLRRRRRSRCWHSAWRAGHLRADPQRRRAASSSCCGPSRRWRCCRCSSCGSGSARPRRSGSSPTRRFSRCSSRPSRGVQPDRPAPPAGGPEPRRARPSQLFRRVILPAALPDILTGHPARRGAGVLRHRDLRVHRRRAWPRLPDQRRPQLLPRAADARRRRAAGAARLRAATGSCGCWSAG